MITTACLLLVIALLLVSYNSLLVNKESYPVYPFNARYWYRRRRPGWRRRWFWPQNAYGVYYS